MKIQDWIVCAFVSSGSPYEFELTQCLLPSLERLKIPHYIEVIENQGSWLKNVAQKPKVVYNAMEKNPSKNIVVLDSDSRILQYPVLFDNIPEEFDIACHYLDWNSWYNNGSNIKELLSGTLWIRNNEKMKKIVLEWYNSSCEDFMWEQKCLAKVLEKHPEIKIFELPLSYVYIASLPNGEKPIVKIDFPHIIHFQKSRKYKRLIH